MKAEFSNAIAMDEPKRLKLLSYNIQSGLSTRRYSEYVTRGWKHFLPVPSRMANLDGIAALLANYDIVALQEVDAGSLRSGFINQVKYLAERARFNHLSIQENRRVGMISQHSNALLSRVEPARVVEHKLPGLIPGRGALHATFGTGANALHVFILHLALGKLGRLRQIRYLAESIKAYRNVVVMGDLNCQSVCLEMKMLLRWTHLAEPLPPMHTFPSWRPTRQLDHILVSSSLTVHEVQVLSQHRFSDHLPIAMEIELPATKQLAA